MVLASRGVQAQLELPGWLSLSRQRLDTALVAAAQQEGTVFVSGVQARLGSTTPEGRRVWLRSEGGQETKVSAGLILAADGLGGRFLSGGPGHGPPVAVAADSRIGAGVVLDQGPAFFRPGTIYMAHGQGGYVGLVRLEDGRLNIAAAFDASFLRGCHNAGLAARRVLAEVGWPAVPGLDEQHWRGTPPLTRRPRHLGSTRVLALGDAAGYVEPFTGEGMAWALASGAAIVPLARRAVAWRPQAVAEWARLHRRIVKRRQWVCWAMAWLTRHPSLTRAVVATLGRMPWLAAPFVRQIGAAPTLR
jgi:2-polyprenyl-6-methoxyphenol hydroxylase-like FAD-dependent oxidoreductase